MRTRRAAMASAALASAFLAGCSTTPMTQAERDQSERTMRALEILNNYANPQRPVQATQPQQAVAFLKRSYVSGFNRICIYNRLGSDYVVTIDSTQFCPISQ